MQLEHDCLWQASVIKDEPLQGMQKSLRSRARQHSSRSKASSLYPYYMRALHEEGQLHRDSVRNFQLNHGNLYTGTG